MASTVQLGTSVTVRGLVPGAETTIDFVPAHQANYFARRLPLDSMLGQALVGAKVGDRLPLKTLGENTELEVLKVQPTDRQSAS